jgi:2-polyprenyl-3-methyl-5-hydroxy-6-metoxy-1,4-benzoquinol methylase
VTSGGQWRLQRLKSSSYHGSVSTLSGEPYSSRYTYNPRPHGSQQMLLAFVGQPARVLDVGCSSGYLAERLQARGVTVIGIDCDEQAAAQARQFCEAVHVGEVETMELPFEPGSFDVVLCGDLIEHLREPTRFLQRVRPLLRTNGRLVLSTPNVANWAMRLSLLFGRFRYTEKGILDRSHSHLFTRKTLLECLDEAGYSVTKLDFAVPVPVLSRPRVEALAHAIGRLRPSLFAYQFVVEAVPVRPTRNVSTSGADPARRAAS